VEEELNLNPVPGKNYAREFKKIRGRYLDEIDQPDFYEIQPLTNDEKDAQNAPKLAQSDEDKKIEAILDDDVNDDKIYDPVKVFVSYSHDDTRALKALNRSFSSMKYLRMVDVWDDGKLIPGEEWDPKIVAKLEAADIVLLLVSSAFVGSYYCMEKEWPKISDRHKKNEVCAVPIYLSEGDFKNLPFSNLQWVPKNKKKYINQYKSISVAFDQVAIEIRELVDSVLKTR
jgi:hypothetical protein